MHLGIEIGGTKLQLGIGDGAGAACRTLERRDVEVARGAGGILRQIQTVGEALIARHAPTSIGIGFGGPVDTAAGTVVKSHHVAGWDGFPLVAWCRQTFGLPAVLHNDADTAALAEARLGAGRGRNPVLYLTVGTGIGGGLIVDGRIYRGGGAGAVEVGHLRPGLQADRPDDIVESLAAGWGIAAAAQERLTGPMMGRLAPLLAERRPLSPAEIRRRLLAAEEAELEYAADLWQRAEGDADRITAKLVGQAAAEGNALAEEILHRAWRVLGWAIAQTVTLLAPEIVVIGGGVSLLGEQLFFEPVRREARRYVFPPLAEKLTIAPAELGEEMVVIGALALAADQAV